MVLEQAMVVSPSLSLRPPSETTLSSLPLFNFEDNNNNNNNNNLEDEDTEIGGFIQSETDLLSHTSPHHHNNICFYSPRREGERGGLREGGPRRLARKKSVSWADESGSSLSKTFATHSSSSYDRTPQFGEGGGVDVSFVFAVVFLLLFVVVIGGSFYHD